MARLPIPFAPLRKPLNQCRFGLATSCGLYHKGHERPFDEERERREPSWGDPSYPSDPRAVAAGRMRSIPPARRRHQQAPGERRSGRQVLACRPRAMRPCASTATRSPSES